MAASQRTVSSAYADYMRLLINPFTNNVAPKKLLDGQVERSAGIRLRQTGELALNTSAVSYIALFPGFGNNFSWQISGSNNGPSPYPYHVNTDENRALIRTIRLAGVGLRLTLNNAALENDGYWEAARVPYAAADFTIASGDWAQVLYNLPTTDVDLSNYQTYQTGKLKDIHLVQFGLNSRDNDHNFVGPPGTAPCTIDKMSDPSWDVIMIKLHGRTASASNLTYDVVSLQEVAYREDTQPARLMTKNVRIPNFEGQLTKTRFTTPAVRRM
jgi:hypothetical protein